MLLTYQTQPGGEGICYTERGLGQLHTDCLIVKYPQRSQTVKLFLTDYLTPQISFKCSQHSGLRDIVGFINKFKKYDLRSKELLLQVLSDSSGELKRNCLDGTRLSIKEVCHPEERNLSESTYHVGAKRMSMMGS